MTDQRKVCFSISKEQQKKIKLLPRDYNLSEDLRSALDEILAKHDSQ